MGQPGMDKGTERLGVGPDAAPAHTHDATATRLHQLYQSRPSLTYEELMKKVRVPRGARPLPAPG